MDRKIDIADTFIYNRMKNFEGTIYSSCYFID